MRRFVVAMAMISLFMLTGCAGAVSPDGVETPAESAPTPVAGIESDETVRENTTSPNQPETAEEAYRSWLHASRVPDAEVACGYLSDELVERMMRELEEHGYPPVSGCEELTVMTAELYRSFGVSAEVDVVVVAQTHTTAELFVTYLDSGECGTVSMERTTRGWIINEDSEGCAA